MVDESESGLIGSKMRGSIATRGSNANTMAVSCQERGFDVCLSRSSIVAVVIQVRQLKADVLIGCTDPACG